jgi:hypothetical protein
MIDVDDTLRSELHRLVRINPRRDWDDVVARAGLRRELARRRWGIAFAVAAAATVLTVSTPLGAAIVRSLDDFSAWLTGKPGTAVSEEEQREFDAANARSWLGFPKGTELRRLITTKAGGATVELVGFRSGSSALCLRLTVTGKSRTSTLGCAPLAELRRAGGPARVLMTDHPVGRGHKVAWYGIDRIHSTNLQITAGIVADDVRSVVLEDDAGRHEVRASSNAFVYVAEQPDVGQRVSRIWARTNHGLVRVPFAPAPFGFGGGIPARNAPPAPSVERKVSGGRIGWLERHEARGESLDVLPPRTQSAVPGRRAANVLFGRVLTPDPDRPMRLVVTLNAHRPGGPAAGLCTWLLFRGGGAGGGCARYPDVFEQTQISSGMMMSVGSAGFVTVSGTASDDVARIEALLANEQRAEIPLKDNAFIVDLPRANLPARLVAYDSSGRVIDVSPPWRDFGGYAGPARGRATSLLRVSGPGGATAELFVGPSSDGGECMFIKHFVDRGQAGVMVGCAARRWKGQPLQLSSVSFPPRFIGGRVRPDVRTVRIRFADGSSTALRPTRGYVLWAASAKHLTSATAAVGADGLGANETVVGFQSFKPPRR